MIQQQINLYHPIFRKQEKKFSAKAMFQAGAVVVGGIVIMYAYSAWQLSSLRQHSAQIDREMTAATKQIEQMGKQLAGRQADQALQTEIKRLEALMDTSQRLRAILRRERFGNTVGFSEHLIAFARQHVAGVWLTGVSIQGGGVDLTVEGRASDPELLPKYLQKLSAENSLSGTRFQTFVMNRPDEEPDEKKAASNKPTPNKSAGTKVAANYVEFMVKTDIVEVAKKKP